MPYLLSDIIIVRNNPTLQTIAHTTLSGLKGEVSDKMAAAPLGPTMAFGALIPEYQ